MATALNEDDYTTVDELMDTILVASHSITITTVNKFAAERALIDVHNNATPLQMNPWPIPSSQRIGRRPFCIEHFSKTASSVQLQPQFPQEFNVAAVSIQMTTIRQLAKTHDVGHITSAGILGPYVFEDQMSNTYSGH